jgi:hypothetical protein
MSLMALEKHEQYRDQDRCFLAGRAIWCNRATDPLLMEAMSYKDELILAQTLGICKICLWGKLEQGLVVSLSSGILEKLVGALTSLPLLM